MLRLNGLRPCMSVMAGSCLLNSSVCVDAAGTAVVTNAVGRLLSHLRVVNVVIHSDVHIIRHPVVKEMLVLPASPFIPVAIISIAIVDPTVETDGGAPVAFIKDKCAGTP